MPADAKAIRDRYNEGIQQVCRIITSGNAGQEQRDTALQTLDDLTAMMLAHTVESVQGRTALLTGLISELTQVIEGIQADPPYEGALDQLTALVDAVRTQLDAEKRNLLNT